MINVLFYLSTFSVPLNTPQLILVISTTTMFECLVFIIPYIPNKWLKLLHTAVYFFFSFLKIFMGIFFRQYGTFDMFSRTGQAKYLADTIEYLVAQITVINILLLLLTIISTILLYKRESKNYSRKYIFSALIIYDALILSTNFFADYEYYQCTLSALINPTEKLEDIPIAEIENDIKGYTHKKEPSNTQTLTTQTTEVEQAGNNQNPPKNSDQEVIELFKNYNHKNQYTGIGKDKNLLIIQVESLQNAFIGKKYDGKEITPNLNRLIEKSFYFTDYFEMLGMGNSSDAEWVSMHSAYSTIKNGGYEDFSHTDVYGLPKIAKDKGYTTISMHPNSGCYYNRDIHHPQVGFDTSYFGESYIQDDMIGMGLSDKSFFRQSVPILKDYKDEKTLTFMITLTCHTPFNMPAEDVVFENKKVDLEEFLEHYANELLYGDTNIREIMYQMEKDVNPNTLFERYLNAVHYTDAAIGEFLEELEKDGTLDNTVIAIYGDHHAFMINEPESTKRLSDFIGTRFDYDEMLNIPLIIYVPGYEKPVLCEQTGSQLDFLPTILNIMGWNEVVTPMFGVDLLDPGISEGNIVLPQEYILPGSQITKEHIFIKNRKEDNYGRLVDRNTREEILDYDGGEFVKYSKHTIHFSNYIYYENLIPEIIDTFKEEHGIEQ